MYLKGVICEEMGWTFTEFDEQPADEVMHYWNLRGIYYEIINAKRRTRDD